MQKTKLGVRANRLTASCDFKDLSKTIPNTRLISRAKHESRASTSKSKFDQLVAAHNKVSRSQLQNAKLGT